MPMPHRTFAQLAKRRLVGKEGRERIREVNALLAELPDYKNGPYADLRKWLTSEIEETRVRSSAVHRDSIAVRREGAAQIALVGPPNVGKSSILQALSEIQIKTGDYPFTTLRPIPALTRIGGVLVQLVEIPGLIEGRDRGPRRRPGAARRAPLGGRDRLLRACRRRSRGARGRSRRGRTRRHRQARVPRSDPRRRSRRRTRSSASRPRFRTSRSSRCRSSTRRAWRPSATPSWRLTGLIRVHLRTAGADRPGTPRARSRRDRRGRRRLGPPRPRRELHRRPGLGAIGPLRRPARGPRPRRPGRRHRRDPALRWTSGQGAACPPAVMPRRWGGQYSSGRT